MERISSFFSWAMHGEAEHPGYDLEPRFRVNAYFHIIDQNPKIFSTHVLKKDVLLLRA